MKDLLARLEKEATEIMEFGNSKEINYGRGMMKTIKRIKDYCKENNIKLNIK